jgi:hypothetical protein
MIFELKRGRRAVGEERDEARAESIFRVEPRSGETRAESIRDEARAE